MKKLKMAALCMTLAMGMTVYAEDISIYINNKSVQMDVTPEVRRSITYVPISFVGKELGAKVTWESPKVTIQKGDVTIVCEVGSNVATRNGQAINLLAPPYVVGGRTLVPLRFVSEQLGCETLFDNMNKRIDITYTGKNPPSEVVTTPIVDEKNFIASGDGLWSVKRELAYSKTGRECVIYLKNNTTGTIKEIYSTPEFSYVDWMNDNRLLLSGTPDLLGGKPRKHVMIYDPQTAKVINVADADSYNYLPKLEAIIFMKRGPKDDPDLTGSDCHMYQIKDGTTQKITKEQYDAYCRAL